MNEEKNELDIFIPETMTEYYITGGAIASSPSDIRLILFKDEIEKNNESSNGSNINMIRTAKTEITMSPLVAKQLKELLDKELEKYEGE